MLTRRDLHKSLLGLALTSLASGSAAAPWVSPDKRALNRLTYGATPDGLAEFSALGLEAWLDHELAKPATNDALEARLSAARLPISYEAGENGAGKKWNAVDENRPLQNLNTDPQSLLPLLDYDQGFDYAERIRPAAEVVAASLIRAVHADAQLREVMTAFWHEHFSVNAFKDADVAIFFPSYDAALRNGALGNFRQLLGEVAKSPSMLNYLNNAESRASPANENYARELLELHTLGADHYVNTLYNDWRSVPGALEGQAEGYIDQDVYEVARAFTGWTIGDGRWLDDGTEAPKSGRFHYAETWHDPYQKRILGVEFASHQAPMQDGEMVLDLLANHKGTARFIAGKLLTRFGIEHPSDGYVAAIADTFRRHVQDEAQIAKTIRALVLHPEFNQTAPSKLKRPFEFLASLYRTGGFTVTSPREDANWQLLRAGWAQHQVRPPTGHSDRSTDWANTRVLNGLVRLALYSPARWFGGVDPEFARFRSAQTFGGLANTIAAQYGIEPDSLAADQRAAGWETGWTLPDDDDGIEWVAGATQAMAALRPEFLLR